MGAWSLESAGVLYAAVGTVALVASVLLTPLARGVAVRIGFYDAPSGCKVHTKLTPYLGGLAIYVSFIVGLISVLGFGHQLTSMVIGATMVTVLGLVDDRNRISVRAKFVGQVVAATVLINSEVVFNAFGNLWLDSMLSLFWVVGIVNALNLMDNMDGLSSGVAAISAFFMFLIAAHNGQVLVAAMAVSLVGACVGFLRYNFSPASIFMGDAGSMFLGYMLAATGLKLRVSLGSTLASFAVPVLVMGLPILDTTLVTVLRWANSRPVSVGGQDHCSHRLVALGLTHRQAVLVLYSICALYGLSALLLDRASASALPPVLGAALVVSLGLFYRLSAVPVYRAAEAPSSVRA